MYSYYIVYVNDYSHEFKTEDEARAFVNILDSGKEFELTEISEKVLDKGPKTRYN